MKVYGLLEDNGGQDVITEAVFSSMDGVIEYLEEERTLCDTPDIRNIEVFEVDEKFDTSRDRIFIELKLPRVQARE